MSRPVPAGMGAASISVPAGLDFGPIYTTAEALGADLELLAEVLPSVETAIIVGLSGNGDAEDEDPTED